LSEGCSCVWLMPGASGPSCFSLSGGQLQKRLTMTCFPLSRPAQGLAKARRIGTPTFDRLPMTARDLAIPILPSRSLPGTLAFYARLGFDGSVVGEGDAYAILTRGDLELHFFLHPGLEPAESWAGCYLRVAAALTGHPSHARPGDQALGHAGVRPDRRRRQPAACGAGALRRPTRPLICFAQPSHSTQ
jgi:hypothetical protein